MQAINRLWTKPLGSFARYALRAYLVGVASLAMAPAMADTATFDIPAEPMPAALKAFASQSHMQLLFKVETVANAHSNAISGELDKHDALQRLLLNSGLEAVYSSDNAATIRPVNTKADQRPAAAHPQEKLTRFNIPAESLAQALKEFGTQSDLSVDAPSDLVAGKKSNVIQGSMASTEALGRLLKGSGLFFTREDDGSVTIHGKPEQSATGPSPAAVGPGQSAEDRTGLAEILVKGSRIMNVDVTRTEDDAQPYTIFDTQQIQQSGAANIEDFLKNMLTMNTTFQTNAQLYNGGGLSTSTINLRGLGANETLVLIDGRRSASVNLINNGTPGQPDVNGIPLAAIERIEVLPGSASAIYGGAAMGGVLNIILKKNFQGGDIGATYDNSFDANSARRTINGTYGFSLQDGKTRVMLSGHYSDSDPFTLGDRLNLVQRGISTILGNAPSFFYNASNPFAGGTTPNIACQDANGNPTNCVLKNGTSLSSPITFIPPGTAPGSNLSAGLLANAGKYNLKLPPGTGEFGLDNQFGTVATTKSAIATIRHEFTDQLEVFTELSTISNSGRQLFNPIGLYGSYTIPASAPTNPFQQAVLINIPTATSTLSTSDSVTQSATVGLIARLPREWRSELDYTWSQNSTTLSQVVPDFNALQAALNDGTINPFVDTLAYPIKLVPYLGYQYTSGRSTLNDLAVRASGPIATLPWGQPTLTVGLEHRKEGYGNEPASFIYPYDPTVTQADAGYFDRGQSQSTDSVYAEALVPLVTEKNSVPGIHELALQLAGRSEHYTVYAKPAYFYGPQSPYYGMGFDAPGVPQTINYTSTNPTIGIKYQPAREVTFRASYATAFLPPTASQLLLNNGPIAQSQAQITDPRNGQIYTVNYFGGGNPALQPQNAKTWDVGLIWEPQDAVLQGLRLNLEHYAITQPNYITTAPVQEIVNNPAFASRVTRDPTTGRITLVDDSNLNATEFKTYGWDFALDYGKPTAIGMFTFHAGGTLIEHDQRQYAIGSPALDYAGFPGEGGEVKLKANATLSFQHKQWTVAWTTTYFGSYHQNGAPGDPCLFQNPGCNAPDIASQGSLTVPSQMYHDIVGTYTFDKGVAGRTEGVVRSMLSGLVIQFGIKNVFNTLPPFDAAQGPYFYSPLGDPRLRSYRITIKKPFGG